MTVASILWTRLDTPGHDAALRRLELPVGQRATTFAAWLDEGKARLEVRRYPTLWDAATEE